MARDSSPLSKRLKALAVRAGLPVDAGAPQHAAPVTTPDDEQPTGEFPALTASDASEDDRPTGEFPAVASTPEAEQIAPEKEQVAPQAEANTATPAGVAVPPPLRAEPQPASAPAPIWMDSPAEEQSPLTAGSSASGPTLAPPTLSKPEPTPEPPGDAASTSDDALGPEAPAPPTELHALADPAPASDEPDTATTSIWAPIGSPPASEASASPTSDDLPSRAADLNDALALSADADDAPSTPPQAPDAAPAAPDAEPAPEPSLLKAVATPTPTADAGDDDPPTPPEAEPSPTTSVRDRLSLTGRFAALRRKTKSDDPDAPAPPKPDGLPAENDAPVEPPTVAAPAVVAPAEPPMVVDVAPSETHPTKPSFSERAALRRRAKTLRARRDTGLLELGAIVLDQRRFGDPTAGALLRRRTDELADLDHEIATIEQALDSHASAAAVAALGAIRCVGCSGLVGPTERYCAHCGTPRPVGGSPSPDASAPSAS